MNFGAENVDLSRVNFTPELLRLIPPEMARQYRVMPVGVFPDRVVVAFEHADLNAVDALAAALKQAIEVQIADELQLGVYLRRFYGE